MTSIFLTMTEGSQESAKELQELRSSKRDYKRITAKAFLNRYAKRIKERIKLDFLLQKELKDDKFDGTRGDGTGGAFSITILSH